MESLENREIDIRSYLELFISWHFHQIIFELRNVLFIREFKTYLCSIKVARYNKLINILKNWLLFFFYLFFYCLFFYLGFTALSRIFL